MDHAIETDYLVVGAGAAGMAFTDAILTHSDACVTLVDRRHAPGGHWLDAYPFVHLHQPSAFYGVASVPLGGDALEVQGLNAGFYEMAGADELRAYYARVMRQHFLPSGRVRFLPCSDHIPGPDGRHQVVSRLTGQRRAVHVRRKLVDTAYVEGTIPDTSAPPFEVAEGVRCIPAGRVTKITDAPRQIVVIGAGKTALDTCLWLLTQGVAPSSICWVKPREGWWLNRRFYQPHDQLPDFYAGAALQVQAFAEAASVDEVFTRLEAEGLLLRVDPSVRPTMAHGAIVSEAELALLRQIQDVVRLGRVRRIQHGRLVLDGGMVSTRPGAVHVHCAAQGLRRRPPRPIYEPGRITVQPTTWGFACFQFELLGVVEALIGTDEARNQLCRPIAYWDSDVDFLTANVALMTAERSRSAHPALAAWACASRLHPMSRIGPHRDNPTVVQARERMKRFVGPALANIARLLAAPAG
jgi:hypothetical protein